MQNTPDKITYTYAQSIISKLIALLSMNIVVA